MFGAMERIQTRYEEEHPGLERAQIPSLIRWVIS